MPSEDAAVLHPEVSETYGSPDDHLHEFEDGLTPAEARAIYEASLEHGSLNTVRLRREARRALVREASTTSSLPIVRYSVGILWHSVR